MLNGHHQLSKELQDMLGGGGERVWRGGKGGRENGRGGEIRAFRHFQSLGTRLPFFFLNFQNSRNTFFQVRGLSVCGLDHLTLSPSFLQFIQTPSAYTPLLPVASRFFPG